MLCSLSTTAPDFEVDWSSFFRKELILYSKQHPCIQIIPAGRYVFRKPILQRWAVTHLFLFSDVQEQAFAGAESGTILDFKVMKDEFGIGI
jgi:hypothetical protein